jgi:hypothetical protein
LQDIDEHPASEGQFEDGCPIRQRERNEIAFLHAKLLQRMRACAGPKCQLAAGQRGRPAS